MMICIFFSIRTNEFNKCKAKQIYIYIEKKMPRDDRLWILCRWDGKRQQASKTQWDHFGRRHWEHRAHWIRNILSTRYRSFVRRRLFVCKRMHFHCCCYCWQTLRERKSGLCFSLNQKERTLLSSFRPTQLLKLSRTPKGSHRNSMWMAHHSVFRSLVHFDFQKWYCHWITIVFCTIA